jgi:uncharacterized DUF497 family protein
VYIGDLEWDDENIEHIAEHNVTPEEVEDVCYSIHLVEKSTGGRYILSGQTTSGRYLNVVVEEIGKGLFKPITAFEMSLNYTRKFKKSFRK